MAGLVQTVLGSWLPCARQGLGWELRYTRSLLKGSRDLVSRVIFGVLISAQP